MGAGGTGSSGGSLVWPVLVGAWSLGFAVPHGYWALGGRAGLGAQAAAADAALDQTWFAAYNLAAGVLGIAGAVVACVVATRSRSSRVVRFLLRACAIAGVALILRGTLGLVLLGVSARDGVPEAPVPAVLLAIEPYFVLGGLVLGGMVLDRRTRASAARPPGAAGE